MALQQDTPEAKITESHVRRHSRFRLLLSVRKLWIVTALALGGDQLVKNVIAANLSRGESWPVEGFVRITHAWNTGAVFSLFSGQNGLLTVISVGAVVILGFYLRSSENQSRTVRIGLALALGGALGNIVDRLRLGHVTDIFDIGPWPIFNTADSAIVVGLALVVWKLWVAESPNKAELGTESLVP